MDDDKLKNLLVLADDPDESIWLSVEQSILELAQNNVDLLHKYWRQSESLLASERIEVLIDQIRFSSLLTDFKTWTEEPNPTLFKGVALVSRILNPDFGESDLKNLLQPIQKNIWIELNNNLTALEKIRIINHLIFEKRSINFKSSLEARSIHLYIPNLLKHNEGHPLVITLLILLLARELNLSIFKVSNGDLPALAYLDIPEFLKVNPDNLNDFDTLFYISLDHHIDVFGKNQFSEYVEHQYPAQNQDLEVVPDKLLIRIVLLKLKLLYEEENNSVKLSQVSQLLQV